MHIKCLFVCPSLAQKLPDLNGGQRAIWAKDRLFYQTIGRQTRWSWGKECSKFSNRALTHHIHLTLIYSLNFTAYEVQGHPWLPAVQWHTDRQLRFSLGAMQETDMKRMRMPNDQHKCQTVNLKVAHAINAYPLLHAPRCSANRQSVPLGTYFNRGSNFIGSNG